MASDTPSSLWWQFDPRRHTSFANSDFGHAGFRLIPWFLFFLISCRVLCSAISSLRLCLVLSILFFFHFCPDPHHSLVTRRPCSSTCGFGSVQSSFVLCLFFFPITLLTFILSLTLLVWNHLVFFSFYSLVLNISHNRTRLSRTTFV